MSMLITRLNTHPHFQSLMRHSECKCKPKGIQESKSRVELKITTPSLSPSSCYRKLEVED